MAIYHFSVKNVSRSDGRSVVACAAYRSGEKLIDERQGKEQDYTKKSGVEFKKIYAPIETDPQLLERGQLWNMVEKIETRKNSQLAREFEIAFPHELKQDQREQLLNDLCAKIVKRHNVIVDAAIHAPHTASGSDERNYHAHILLTTRSINDHGQLEKKTREFNDHGKQQVEYWREEFANLCNHYLKLVGSIERVDHRSNQERGLELEATQHEGPKVTQLRRQGIFTEISIKNDQIRIKNLERLMKKQLEQNIMSCENFIQNTVNGISTQIEIEKKRSQIKEQIAQSHDKEISDLYSFLIEKKAELEELEKERPWIFTKKWLAEMNKLADQYNGKSRLRNSLINLDEADIKKRYLSNFTDEEKQIYLIDINKNFSDISEQIDSFNSVQKKFYQEYNSVVNHYNSLELKERKRDESERYYIFEEDCYGNPVISHTKNSPDKLRRYYKAEKMKNYKQEMARHFGIKLPKSSPIEYGIGVSKSSPIEHELIKQQADEQAQREALERQQAEQRQREQELLRLRMKQQEEKRQQETLRENYLRARNSQANNKDDDYTPF